MRVIEALVPTNASLTSSNVAEDDHPVWNAGATYAISDRVIVIGSVHRVYEAIAVSTGKDPTDLANAAYWLELGATNRWKVFDLRLSDPTVKPGSITYSITPGVSIAPGAVAFFALVASEITVQVTDPTEGVIFTETRNIVDSTSVFDWFSYLFEPVVYDTEAIFSGVPLYSGVTLNIEVTSAGDTEVGQIVFGQDHILGKTLVGTEIGIEDFSSKGRDDFGNAIVVERAFAQTARFNFTFPPDDARRVQRVLSRLRAQPAVYYAGDGTSQFGTTVFGFFQDFSIPLTIGQSFATLDIEGLV